MNSKGLIASFSLLAIFCMSVFADAPREEPVGLILLPGQGKVLRAGSETPLAARAGDILFAGDSLRSGGGASGFLYCPTKISQTLDQGGEVLLDSKQLKVKSGKLSGAKPVNACFLPTMVRVAVASQQHYGVSMTRGLAKPDDAAIAFNDLPANVKAEVTPFENALKANPNDTQALIEEAATFDRDKLEANALATYRKASAQWPDAVWIKGRMFELEEALATEAAIKAAAISPDAKTYAMVVGIGKYEKLPPELFLQYPGADATAFGKYLTSPDGAKIPAEQMLVLTDEQATTAALRNAFQTFLKARPGKKDTVFILLAAHGTVDTRGGYIVTYDSDPQDLSSTAIPMAEIQTLVEDELSKVGRVVLLADLCHATTIGNTRASGIGSVVEKLGQAPGEMLGMMASRQGVSQEGTQFGGGHGAFTYSILKGLEGAADQNKTNKVTAGGLRDYVRTDVATETGNKQHPRDFGSMANETPVVDVSKAGINISRFKSLYDSRTGEPLLLAQAAGAPPISAEARRDIDAFQAAIKAKHLLPTDPASPWPLVDKMRAELSPQMMFLQENNLRVALEDQAQQVLLRYLAGDQNPQTKNEFDAGSQYMEAAMKLTPESLYLLGRDSFFLGRALLFEKQFGRAADLLEASVRIDPGEAYGYNALGIAYLEQADFAKAIPAFRDAAKRAPNWSYPLHNLALAYVEAGRAEEAIQSYQQAMKVTPTFGYLPYNLGLIYQRLNRRKEAEDSYRKAALLSPTSAEPLNALGTLKSAEGKSAEAEKLYRSALEKNPNLLPARHNLGVLLSSNKDRQPEAIELWKQNLAASSDYLPSRLALAELLAKRDDAAGAIDQYRLVIAQTPDYLGARVALASQLIKAKQPEAALEQLRIAVKVQDKNAQLWEQIGDVEKSLNHNAESRDAYATALKLESENSDRKRLRTKMAF